MSFSYSSAEARALSRKDPDGQMMGIIEIPNLAEMYGFRGPSYQVPRSKGGVMSWYDPKKANPVIIDPGTEFERIFDPTTGKVEPVRNAKGTDLLRSVMQNHQTPTGANNIVSTASIAPVVPETKRKNDIKVTFAVTNSPILITSKYHKYVITEGGRYIVLIRSLDDEKDEMLDFVTSTDSVIGIYINGENSVLITKTSEYGHFEFDGLKFQVFKILEERFPDQNV